MDQHNPQLMPGKHRRHVLHQSRLFKAGLSIVVCFYLVVVFADFFAPYDYRAQSRNEPLQSPASLHFRDAAGQWRIRPFIYQKNLVDPLERAYAEDTSRSYPVGLLSEGYSYSFFGLFTTKRHLFGVRSTDDEATPRLHLLGTDALGRDRLSRLIIATRFSLIVGPLGTILAGALGALLGCISGYSKRWADVLLMRAADTMMALPTLVLVLAARAAFPLELPPARAAILLIGIFVFLGWAEMSRLARGLVLELREREFVTAAVSLGASPIRVLFRHILPNAAGPLLVQLLLMLPAFLLAETALSFLGVGLQEPEASWGTLLASAADVTLLENGHALMLLMPGFAIATFVLAARLIAEGINRRQQS